MKPLAISPFDLKVLSIFYPYAFEQTFRARAANPPTSFVHYSSADAAMKVLKSKQVWMRKAATMNDFREIDYGRECLELAWKGEEGRRFKTLLDGMFPGFSDEIETRFFREWYPHLWNDTFLTCLSEHNASEDENGRLSMWRAYGGSAGVAVVLHGELFLSPSDALKAYTSPVAYLTMETFAGEFAKVTNHVEKEHEFVRALGKESVFGHVLAMFRAAVTCTKHPGFLEEKEWRVVYTPKWARSTHIIESVETIVGVPQVVQKIPLHDVPDEGLIGVEIPKLLRRIIVGPSNFPHEIREALVRTLTDQGVEDAAAKVVVSNIPLRSV